MNTSGLSSNVCYSGTHKSASWQGRHVDDRARFVGFMRDVVRPRVTDDDASFESELRGLATTGMATEFVERLLKAVPTREAWEIGEALAECALAHDSGHEVHWPWNTVRDRRTPRASLPGTDLVGFYRNGATVLLLFGEVKTSADAGSPPNVMYGGSGMAWQLEESAKRLDIQRTLLAWLQSRCHSDLHRELYQSAVGRFLSSKGRELLIIGVLVRDTQPNEADLQSRGKALAQKLDFPTRVELFAWYLPVPIADWPGLLREETL